MISHTKQDNARARQLYKEAISVDPKFASAYTFMGWTHFWDARYGWSESRAKSINMAFEMAQKALALDDQVDLVHGLLASIHFLKREWEKGISAAERAVALNPNGSASICILGSLLSCSGRWEEGIPFYEKGIRLMAFPPAHFLYFLGRAYMMTERYEEAVGTFEKAIRVSPDYLNAHIGLAATYSLQGREADARTKAAEVLKIRPKFSLDRFAKTLPYENRSDRKFMIEALRKAGLPDKPPLPLPDNPSIAVLPFINMSEDPKQEYFSDGMTDDLITDLSKISGLFVIARNSVFTYKGKSVKVEQIGRELGVRYILEGSVRRADKQVRINAQLIDAKTGGHLWAERYDGKMGDVFALQDKITGKIVAALAVKLTPSEQEQMARKDTNNLEAYDAFLKGWEHYLRLTFDGFAKARSCFEKSVELDPNYGQAYAALAQTYWIGSNLGLLGVNFIEARLRASEYLQMAMKNPTSLAHQVAADMLLFRHEHDEAIKAAERAIALNPHDPSPHWIMARTLIMTGRPEVAVDFIKRAIRLDPHNPGRYWFLLGLAHFGMGQLEETVTFIERALILHPEANKWAGPLAAAYAHLGRDPEARAALDNYIKGWPYIFQWRFGTANLEKEMYFWPLKDPKTADRLADGLIKAGLSAQPSGYYKVSEENKLTGEEIRRLSFGRTVAGFDLWSGGRWWVDRTKGGETTFRGLYPGTTTGTSWIEGDMLCHQWQVHSGKRKYCGPVFRNPEGTPETKNEYLLITYIGIYPFLPMD